MKITRLIIDGYKNLKLKLVHKTDIIAIIGNNASGKSNLLEALSLIFKSLYKRSIDVSFDYLIEYTLTNRRNILIIKKKSNVTYELNGETIIDISDFLPKRLVAIYSGEEQRMWKKCYQPIYDEFIDDINKSASRGIAISKILPQMLYLNKYYWDLCLLTLLLSDLEDNKKFVKDVLGINKVNKIKFEFNKNNYKSYTSSVVLSFIKKIDTKSEYTISQLKDVLNKNNIIPDDVFKYLYYAFSPKKTKIIKKITILFNNHLTVEDLSEGEKKLLLIRSSFEFAEQEDSLFLLDEPDAHIHVNNKEEIIKIMEPYKLNRQIVMTTHSPTISQTLTSENLYMLTNGGLVEKAKQKIIEELTSKFWSKQKQNIFLNSDNDIILVEGKYDIKFITSAINKIDEDQYRALNNLEYIPTGGASGLRLFIDKFNPKETQKIIAILDYDIAGTTEIKEVLTQDQQEKLNKNEFVEIDNLSNTFLLFLPKLDRINNSQYEIEDYFPIKKLKDISKEQIETFKVLKDFTLKRDFVKRKLNEKVDSFKKEDFNDFRKLLDVINKIKNDYPIYSSEESSQNSNLKKADKKTSINDLFYIKRKGIVAKCQYNKKGDSIVLKKGSQVLRSYTPATTNKYKKERDKILKSLKLRQGKVFYTIEEDRVFSSPSAAAKFVNGGTMNGPKEWKNKDGLSIGEVIEKNKPKI